MGAKTASKMLMKSTPGVNFTNLQVDSMYGIMEVFCAAFL